MTALNSHMVFIGIGGIGMSALARHCLRQGKPVFGYDKVRTELTTSLESEGAIITYEENIDSYPGWAPKDTTVVYTPAIPKSNAWISFFASFSPIKRAQALAGIAHNKRCLAVAGTHGKTSTSALLTHILTEAGEDPTAFIGGIMSATKTNYRLGNGQWIVVEADEFDRSFLHLHPEAAAITTIDADHLDTYEHENSLKEAFGTFRGQVSSSVFTPTSLKDTILIGSPGSHAWASEINPENGAFHFTLNLAGEAVQTALYMPGHHNVTNAVLAASLAHFAGVPVGKIGQAIQNFAGIRRRFEYHLHQPITLIEDYAHHPTEINALVRSIKALYPEEKICLCFQPHLYSRTRDFMDGFAEALDRADKVFLLPIYPAREKPIEGISSHALAAKMKHARVVEKKHLAASIKVSQPEVVLIVGAGDIGDLVPIIKAEFACEK